MLRDQPAAKKNDIVQKICPLMAENRRILGLNYAAMMMQLILLKTLISGERLKIYRLSF
jgi:hypothetical protein